MAGKQPFQSFEIFWQNLEQSDYLPHPLTSSPAPYHPNEFYDNLWQLEKQVDGAELLHDALLQC
jgi:hypothetical protein